MIGTGAVPAGLDALLLTPRNDSGPCSHGTSTGGFRAGLNPLKWQWMRAAKQEDRCMKQFSDKGFSRRQLLQIGLASTATTEGS
jgi:hypothetical protein